MKLSPLLPTGLGERYSQTISNLGQNTHPLPQYCVYQLKEGRLVLRCEYCSKCEHGASFHCVYTTQQSNSYKYPTKINHLHYVKWEDKRRSVLYSSWILFWCKKSAWIWFGMARRVAGGGHGARAAGQGGAGRGVPRSPLIPTGTAGTCVKGTVSWEMEQISFYEMNGLFCLGIY